MNQVERAEILQMIEHGEVSAEEAIDMLSAQRPPVEEKTPVLEESQPSVAEKLHPQKGEPEKQTRRCLHIQVTNLKTGTPRVKVNLPLHWMKFGWKIGSRFVPELEDLDVDELLSPLDQAISISLVEIEDKERIEIYIE